MPALGVRDCLRGIFPATPTPFDAHGGLDLESLGTNIETWNRQPLSGYALLGSNGEAAELTRLLQANPRSGPASSNGWRRFSGAAGTSAVEDVLPLRAHT